MADTRFGEENTTWSPWGGSVEIFPANRRPRPWGAQAPTYLCEGKETASVAYASSGAAG